MKKTLVALVAASAALAMSACSSDSSVDEPASSSTEYTVGDEADEFVDEYLSEESPEPSGSVTFEDGVVLSSYDYTLGTLQNAWDEASDAEHTEACEDYVWESETTVQETMDVDEDFHEEAVIDFYELYCN